MHLFQGLGVAEGVVHAAIPNRDHSLLRDLVEILTCEVTFIKDGRKAEKNGGENES